MRVGFLQCLVILVVILLIFGPKQIPKLVTVIQDAVSTFKLNVSGDKASENDESVEDKKEQV